MRVAVRQSCLGTVRCGAVMFDEARQSWQCRAWCVWASFGRAWRNAAVMSRQVQMRQGMDWCGMAVGVCFGHVWLVGVR